MNRTLQKARHHAISYALIAPAFLVLAVFVFEPIVYSLVLSFQKYRLGFATRRFVGFENFKNLLASPEFWQSLAITAVYSFYMVAASLVLGLFLAVVITGRKNDAAFWQVIYFLPVTATMAAMAIVWRFILNVDFGFLNNLLRALHLPVVNWLKDPRTAMGSVIFISVWANAGYAMVLFLAGIANIPGSLYEAAAIDGSNKGQDFRFITWPLISPTTLFAVIIMTRRALSSFDTIKVLTNGGPINSTRVLSLLLYQEAFQFFNIGYASVIAVVFFVLVLAVALVQLKLEKRVFYQ